MRTEREREFMNNKKASAKNTMIAGNNIYQDKFGNTIYFDKKNNLAYKISQDKVNTFQTLQMRYILCLIAFILFYILFKLNIWLSIGITIVIGIFLEYRFRKFLKLLPKTTKFEKKDRMKPIDQMIESSIQDLILRFVLYGMLGILLIVNTFISENVKGQNGLVVISYVVAVFAFYMAYKYLILVIRKKKNK